MVRSGHFHIQILHSCGEVPCLECWGSIQQGNMHAYELRAVAALQMESIHFCSWFLAKILPFAASFQAKILLLNDGSQSHQTIHGGSNAHQERELLGGIFSALCLLKLGSISALSFGFLSCSLSQ